jgi:hypothetical protein
MNTIPDAIEYRSNFVAWGGGLRLRLKATLGLRGRAILMDSLHVDRGSSGDRAFGFLRRIPSVRVVRTEHVDLHPELLGEEMGVLSKHGELVQGTESF